MMRTAILLALLAAPLPVAAQPVPKWIAALCDGQFNNLIDRRDCALKEQAAIPRVTAIEEIYGEAGRILIESCNTPEAPSFAAAAACAEAEIEAAIEAEADTLLSDPEKRAEYLTRTSEAQPEAAGFGQKVTLPQLSGDGQ
ncbi:MAG: hypothetical protein AAFY59_15350 [Pseudomonadota bacterium]